MIYDLQNLSLKCLQANLEKSLKSSMTEAKISFCENCNTTVTDTTGIVSTDPGTRVITIIEATDDLDGNMVLNSNSIFSGSGNDKRQKRDVEVPSLIGNETISDKDDSLLLEEIVRENLNVSKQTPIKRDIEDRNGLSDMTQAIMEQRVDYDSDEEFRATNGHGYDAPRTRPVNNYRGYNQHQHSVSADSDDLEDADDFDEGDHKSHYEYVPMEIDDYGNHR